MSQEMNMSRSLGEARVIYEARNILLLEVCETGGTWLHGKCVWEYEHTESDETIINESR